MSRIPPTPLRYEVDLSRTVAHEVGVRMHVDLPGDEPLDLVMPHLSPGSPTNSLNHEARLSRLSVTDASGRELPLEKLREGGFRVQPRGPMTVRYTVAADNFSHVRAYLSDQCAYLNGPATLMYVRGHEHDTPAVMQLTGVPDASWGSISTLAAVEGAPHTYYASHYDDLADSNTFAGRLDLASAEVQGTRLVVNQHGTPPWANGPTAAESLDDLSRLYTQFLEDVGPFPLERYTVTAPRPSGVEAADKYVVDKHYLHGATAGAGGYEHYHGHELLLHKDARRSIDRLHHGDGRAYERGIMAHELVHKLLAKLVRHDGIDAEDLSDTHRTDGLWLTEGVTDWAGLVLERRAGFLTRDEYVEHLQDMFDRYMSDVSRNPTSPRDDSMDAHSGVGSYYNKGAVAGALLDLEIRHATGGRRCMLDLLRALKVEFGGTGRGHTLDDLERLSVGIAGPSVKRFFEDHLRGREPFDFDRALGYVGYRLAERTSGWTGGSLALPDGSELQTSASGDVAVVAAGGAAAAVASAGWAAAGSAGAAAAGGASPAASEPLELPTFGLTVDGTWKIVRVSPDGPAARAGLRDFQGEKPVRVAAVVDGQPVEGPFPSGRLDALTLTFVKPDMFTGEARETTLTVGAEPVTRTVLEPLPAASPEQLALRALWLSAADGDRDADA